MIIDKEIEINIINSNKKRYKDIGYDTSNNKIFVSINDLPKNSHVKINCKCCECGGIKMNREILFSNWSGYDYYDDEFIKNNLLLDKNNDKYPSIDHKIPAIYAFLNNISPMEISNISNLCITKRILNSKKGQSLKNIRSNESK